MKLKRVLITLNPDLAKDPFKVPSDEVPSESEVPSEDPPEPFMEEAEWIRREHEILTYDAAAFIERAAKLGEALVKVKERIRETLGPGVWGAWVERNLPNISDRTVRRYMEIFRRQSEPLALEDPGAFLAEVNGHRELQPPDTAADSKTDAASEKAAAATTTNNSNGGAKPPSKRTPKKATKAKTSTPPTAVSTETSTVPGQNAGPVSLEKHIDLAADALEKLLAEWKRSSLASLKEAARGNARLAGGLDRLGRDIDGLVSRLRGYRRSPHSYANPSTYLQLIA
jgi:hypothetical protein